MAFSMKVTPEIEELTNICLDNSKMDVSLYGKYDVKRGLRDINGVGVLAGLTQISNVVSSDIIDGVKTPCDGRLYYRGINVEKLTQGFLSENRMGFEEVAYLLLFGNLPNEEQLNHFKTILKQQQSLPKNFVRDVVMKAPTKDMMNTLSRSVLTLYAYDNHADDTSLPNVLRQCINLISVRLWLSGVQPLYQGKKFIYPQPVEEAFDCRKYSSDAPTGSEVHSAGGEDPRSCPRSPHGARRR